MNSRNSIIYRLKNPPREFEYHLEFDVNGLIVEKNSGRVEPEWTRLTANQCPHCPYTEAEKAYCPVAVNIARFVADWQDSVSFQTLELTVITPQRTIINQTDLQSALRSVLGLVVAGSDCKHMAFFRLMARHHLPLASSEETVIRAASFYVLREFLEHENNGTSVVDLSGLGTLYDNSGIVNLHLSRRIRTLDIQDGVINAIVALDAFGKTVSFSLQDSLLFLRSLFRSNPAK